MRAATSAAVPRSGFAGAQAAWKQSASAAAANVSRYLLEAAGDLKSAGASGAGAAVRELTDLAAVPETGTTPAQRAQAKTDVAALDRFFKTPGLTPTG